MNIREIPEHELARLREKAKEISGSHSDYHSSYTELLSRRLNGEPLQYIEEYIPVSYTHLTLPTTPYV